jgi:hypothetical protein
VMRTHPTGARAPSRHSCGPVRLPRGAAHPRGQRVPPGLLLAHRGRRCQRDRAHLRRVLILRLQN